MAQLKDFRQELSLSVGNVYEPILDRSISGAAIEFCDKTRLWVEELNPLTIVSGVSEYDLDYDCINRVLIDLTEVFHDDHQIYPEPVINLKRMYRDWRSRTADNPNNYYISGQDKIRLFPGLNANTTGQLTFHGTFKPHRKSTEVPDTLYNDYFDAIIAGAEYRLHSMKGKSWYSPNDSMESKDRFLRFIGDGKIEAKKSRTNAPFKLRIRGAA